MDSPNPLKSTENPKFFEFSELSEFFKFFEFSEVSEISEIMNLESASKNPNTSITTGAAMSIESSTTPTAPNFSMIGNKNDSIDQIINRSINQSIDQSANQSVNQSIDQSANRLINQLIDQSANQSINQSIDQSANRPAENMTKNFTYTLENSTRSNFIKKQKSDYLKKISLFASSLNRQKVNIKLQEAKAAMLTVYAIAENSHMLSIVDQINPLINGSNKIVKANITIEILMMQIKLNTIIKNQGELIKNQIKTKPETAKIGQNSNKQHISKPLQPPQIKLPIQQQFGPLMV